MPPFFTLFYSFIINFFFHFVQWYLNVCPIDINFKYKSSHCEIFQKHSFLISHHNFFLFICNIASDTAMFPNEFSFKIACNTSSTDHLTIIFKHSLKHTFSKNEPNFSCWNYFILQYWRFMFQSFVNVQRLSFQQQLQNTHTHTSKMFLRWAQSGDTFH